MQISSEIHEYGKLQCQHKIMEYVNNTETVLHIPLFCVGTAVLSVFICMYLEIVHRTHVYAFQINNINHNNIYKCIYVNL